MRSLILFGNALVTSMLCSAQETPEPIAKTTYDDHVKPILRQHCFACHTQSEQKGGLVLDNYTSLREGGGSGEVVYDDGDVENSRLWLMVSHQDTPNMPPNQDKLPDEKLAVIRKWIEGGVLENSGSKARPKKKNALAVVATSNIGGRPAEGGAMPGAVPQQSPVVTERAAAATAIAASPWAPLITLGGQRQIPLYHADTQELLGILPFEDGIPQSIRFSRDGSFLIVSGGEHSVRGVVAVYEVTTGERVATIGDELDIAFDGDANDSMSRIALGGPRRLVRVFDAVDGTQLHELKKHTDWIYSLAYSPDGVLIASGDRSGGLCVWESETAQLYLDLAGHKGAIHRVAWRDDSNVLASASDDGTVKLWDMHQGKLIKSISAHAGGVTAVDFDHQGRLVTAGKDKRVKLWDPAGNHLRDFQPMGEQVLEAAITHDGSRVVYGDWGGETISALVEDPAQKAPLAANPPSLESRIDELRGRLNLLAAELQPLEQHLVEANRAVAAARNSVQELQNDIDANRSAAERAQGEVAAGHAKAEKLRAEILRKTTAARDAHDAVIAERHQLKSNAEQADQGRVALAEQQLAEQLTTLASDRRILIATEQTITTNSDLAKHKQAQVDTLSAQLRSPQSVLDAAERHAALCRESRDSVATREAVEKEKLARFIAELIR